MAAFLILYLLFHAQGVLRCMDGVQDWSGKAFGDYRLSRLLGSGQSGQVYVANHRYLDIVVAIKVFKAPASAGDGEVSGAGARLVAQMRHPHLVRVLGRGIEGGHYYVVMDYAPNGSLRDRCPRGSTLSLAELVPYVWQCADALDYLHYTVGKSQQVALVHCDVKPENILFGPDGEVWLSDFDLAVAVKEGEEVTIEQADGDVLYMAREHLQLLPRPASDQYALGTVAYELLCGQTPFQGEFFEVLRRKMKEDAPPPPAGVAPGVAEVVMRALASEPEERFRTVLEFAAALKKAAGVP